MYIFYNLQGQMIIEANILKLKRCSQKQDTGKKNLQNVKKIEM